MVICVGIPVVATFWYRIRAHESDNELKRTMIERGMSVEEIERVLAAKSPSDKRIGGPGDKR
jgi:hypothetical protein